MQFIERSSHELPVTMQAELLSLNRSSLYYQPQPPSATEVGIKHRIDELYTRWPFYGSRRITAHLQQEGVIINRKTVQRHMREMGIEGVSPGPNLSKRTQKEGIYPYLLRLVLTRESGERKREEVDMLHEGKRPCKRYNERLRKSSNWKRFSW